jgi:protein-S-isoprenylcysteine O-methyltransferase Ste14
VLKVGYVPVEALNEPQAPTGAQLQYTPRLFASLLTVAATVAVVPAAIADGGGVLSVTWISVGGSIVMAGALALIALLSIEVAVMTTVLAGTEAGAV